MKKTYSLFITLFCCFLVSDAQVYDSLRSGKPESGTIPRIHNPVITPDPQQQTINHGATESNDPTNLSDKNNAYPLIINPQTSVPSNPVTIDGGVAPIETSTNDKGVMQNGESNVSNPIRK
ncbi:MAG: hypothetical protein ABIR19_06280 [Ginsengibacter sp.]